MPEKQGNAWNTQNSYFIIFWGPIAVLWEFFLDFIYEKYLNTKENMETFEFEREHF